MPAAPRSVDEKRYLREVEQHFRMRRGSPLLISPRDWALAVSWFEQGIPLSSVIAGIDEVFDREGRPSVRSLAFCRHAVEEFWRARQRGLPPGRYGHSPPASMEVDEPTRMRRALEEAAEKLRSAGQELGEKAAIRLRPVVEDLEAASGEILLADRSRRAEIESRVMRADAEIGTVLREESSPERIEEATRQAEERLAVHRKHMSARTYAQTLERAVENRLRQHHGLGRLTLLLLL